MGRIPLILVVISLLVLSVTSSFLESARGILNKVGLLDDCFFEPEMTLALKNTLPGKVRGQDEALVKLFNIFETWEDLRRESRGQPLHPLTIVITGPTGVGKNYVSNLIGHTIFGNSKCKKANSESGCRCNRIIVGGNYQSFKETTPAMKDKLRDDLRSEFYDHIEKCHEGKAMIIIDEFQKIEPGVLSVLSSALDGSQNFITSPTKPEQLSTKNCIFFFITDASQDSLKELVVKYESREKIPYQKLETTVFDDIAKEKKRLFNDAGASNPDKDKEINMVSKYFNIIVPFLPLEPIHVQEVINLQFELLQEDGIQSGWWKNLVIDYKVANFYANNNKCIDYNIIGTADGSLKKRFSVYGARRISPFFDGPVKILHKRISKVVKDSKIPRRNEVLVVSSIDEDTYKILQNNNMFVKSDTKMYILMQWCILDDTSTEQFEKLDTLTDYINSARLDKFGMECQSKGDVCSNGDFEEMLNAKKNEIDSIFKNFITQSQCSTVFVDTLQCT